jgi:ATP-dependent RNA helicase RhlE
MTTTKKKSGAKAAAPKRAKPAKSKPSKTAKSALPAAPAAEPLELDAPAPTLAQAEAATIDITFADLGLGEAMLASLLKSGYARPTPIQAQAVPLALKGRDLMGLAQTGTGKTAAFTIPIIERLIGGPKRTRALILTPTRELCQQVEAAVRKYGHETGLDVVSVYGGVGYDTQVTALRNGVDIIVATPGRLIDHVEKQNVVFDDLEVLVLDEADRMLDMGFAPQINKIVAAIHPYRQTLLFSATMPPEVEALARKYLRKPVVVQVGRRSQAAATVRHFVYPVPGHRKTALLTHLLGEMGTEDSILVFTRTKHGADRVVRHLEEKGIPADAMHADKSQGQREQALAKFKDGRTRVLVATDIAQRGLDISGISHVINYDVPTQAEDYVHRIGRTGRAAKEGDAFTFMSTDEIGMVRTIERVIGQEIPRISVAGFDFGT